MSSLKQFQKWKTVTLSQCVIKWVMIANEVVWMEIIQKPFSKDLFIEHRFPV